MGVCLVSHNPPIAAFGGQWGNKNVLEHAENGEPGTVIGWKICWLLLDQK